MIPSATLRPLAVFVSLLVLAGCAPSVVFLKPVVGPGQEVKFAKPDEPVVMETRDGLKCGVRIHKAGEVWVVRCVVKNMDRSSVIVNDAALYDANGSILPLLNPESLANAISSGSSAEAAAALASAQVVASSAQNLPQSYTITGSGQAVRIGSMAFQKSNYNVSADPNPGAAAASGFASGAAIGALARQRRSQEEANNIVAWAYHNSPVPQTRLNEGNFYFQSRGEETLPLEFSLAVVDQKGDRSLFSFHLTEPPQDSEESVTESAQNIPFPHAP